VQGRGREKRRGARIKLLTRSLNSLLCSKCDALLPYRARLASLRLSCFSLLKRSLTTCQICTAPVCRDDVPHLMWIVSSLSRRPLGLHRSCMLCFSWRYECVVSRLEARLTSKHAVVCHGNDESWVWAPFRTHSSRLPEPHMLLYSYQRAFETF
jgi:hypothetical protein